MKRHLLCPGTQRSPNTFLLLPGLTANGSNVHGHSSRSQRTAWSTLPQTHITTHALHKQTSHRNVGGKDPLEAS